MAKLGYRTINEMVGHTEVLKVREDIEAVRRGEVLSGV